MSTTVLLSDPSLNGYSKLTGFIPYSSRHFFDFPTSYSIDFFERSVRRTCDILWEPMSFPPSYNVLMSPQFIYPPFLPALLQITSKVALKPYLSSMGFAYVNSLLRTSEKIKLTTLTSPFLSSVDVVGNPKSK